MSEVNTPAASPAPAPAASLVNITQDHSLLDPFDFDVAIPEIADIQAFPISWMADADSGKNFKPIEDDKK